MPHPNYIRGYRGECEVRQILRDAGIPVRRVPLSGGAPGSPNDLIVGEGAGEERWEVKRRKEGFSRIYNSLVPDFDEPGYVELVDSLCTFKIRMLGFHVICKTGMPHDLAWVQRRRDWILRSRPRRWLEDCEVVAFRVDRKPWLVGVRV